MKSFTKTKSRVFTVLLSALLLLVFTPQKVKAEEGPGISVNIELFYNELAPYGTWFQDPQYGMVWAPQVGRDFRPYYTNGYWMNTNYGNMWMSNYAWGWAPFHYGRWTYSNLRGWFWIPGMEWGPAWVSWREGGGMYGWAPMGPGISINIAFGSNYRVPNNYWTFLPYQNLYTRNIPRYYRPSRTTTIINKTTIINNTYIDNSRTYIAGPSRTDFRNRTGRNIDTYHVGFSDKAGRSTVGNRQVSVYRPTMNQKERNKRNDQMRRSVAQNNQGSRGTDWGSRNGNINSRRPLDSNGNPGERMRNGTHNSNRNQTNQSSWGNRNGNNSSDSSRERSQAQNNVRRTWNSEGSNRTDGNTPQNRGNSSWGNRNTGNSSDSSRKSAQTQNNTRRNWNAEGMQRGNENRTTTTRSNTMRSNSNPSSSRSSNTNSSRSSHNSSSQRSVQSRNSGPQKSHVKSASPRANGTQNAHSRGRR